MLDLVGLGKRFGEKVVLRDLSFSVAPGQMFGFVGTNGAGKTTTMRIAMGVLATDAGEVRWRDTPANAAIRRRWGYMPEERGLYAKMRILDQLVYFAELHGMSRADARASAEGWLRTLGVSGAPSDRLETLSLGNQQRVQLAAALVHEPELLILDEPFSGLDPVGVDVMANALRSRVEQGVSVVFSSHQLDLVERLCDAVGIIKDGRMHAVGTVRELRGDNRAVRYRVAVDGPATGGPTGDGPAASGRAGGNAWAAGVPGVTVLADDADGVLVELAQGTDEQALLDAARAAGRVRAFAPVNPSLTELFREVVNGDAQAPSEAPTGREEARA